MRITLPTRFLGALLLALTLLPLAARAQTGATPVSLPHPLPVPLPSAADGPSPAYQAALARWQSSLTAFAEADKQHPAGADGVLFVGSSTIRFWTDLAQDFRQAPVVINRGFGGSTMDECNLFARELVLRYKPRHVLVYAGDNDLAQGRTPIQVLESFSKFAATVRAELPATRISYISIKPSPARESLLKQVRETNNVIEAYVRTLANSEYIDIYTPMVNAEGRPRAELFLPDQLHLNRQGYRLWQSVIASHVQAAEATTAAAR